MLVVGQPLAERGQLNIYNAPRVPLILLGPDVELTWIGKAGIQPGYKNQGLAQQEY